MFQKLKSAKAAAGAFLLSVGVAAHAAVPAPVTAAIDTMEDDGVIVAGSVLAAYVTIWSIKRLRQAL